MGCLLCNRLVRRRRCTSLEGAQTKARISCKLGEARGLRFDQRIKLLLTSIARPTNSRIADSAFLASFSVSYEMDSIRRPRKSSIANPNPGRQFRPLIVLSVVLTFHPNSSSLTDIHALPIAFSSKPLLISMPGMKMLVYHAAVIMGKDADQPVVGQFECGGRNFPVALFRDAPHILHHGRTPPFHIQG